MRTMRNPILMICLVLALSALACSLPLSVATPTTGGPTVDVMATQLVPAFTAQAGLTMTAAYRATQAPTAPPRPTATATPLPATPVPTQVPTSAPGVAKDIPAKGVLRAVFTDGGHNLWVWSADSAARKVTNSGDVMEGRVADDGLQIAYLRCPTTITCALSSANLDGTQTKEIVSERAFTDMQHSTSADGVAPYVWGYIPGEHALAFSTQPIDSSGGMTSPTLDLWTVNTDTGKQTNLLNAGSGGVFYYAPNGSQIAIVNANSINLVNADGSNRRTALTFPQVLTYSEFVYYPNVQWALDSSVLYAVVPPADSLAKPAQSTTLWKIPTDGTAAAMLGAVVTNPLAPLKFSPDLKQIAYLADSLDGKARNQLHLAQVSGVGDEVYRTDVSNILSWAPDSSRFVYSSGGLVYLGQAGQGPTQVVDTKTALTVDWLNANQILFLYKSLGGWELRTSSPGAASTLVAGISGDPAKFIPTYSSNY